MRIAIRNDGLQVDYHKRHPKGCFSFNEILVEICKKNNVEIIDAHFLFIQRGDYSNLFIEDGVHPNSKVHKLIFFAVKKYFEGKGVV